MASGSRARASSDLDFVPGMVPFEWEDAPGKPAVTEIEEIEVVESPRLPPPPGRRFKDSFLSPAQIPNVEGSSHREKKSKKLQYLKPTKKSSFKSRKSKKQPEADIEDTSGIFSPVASHRITRKVLVESQKKSSCFGLCWHESSSHRDKRSGSVAESVNLDSPAASGSSLASPRDGQTRIDGAQKPSSRFMASMLLSLLSDSDESDYETAADGGPRITDHKARLSELLTSKATPASSSDEVRISKNLATPRAPVLNPPATPASSSDEVRISESLATPRAPVLNSCRRTLPGSDDSASRSAERHTASDAHSRIGSPSRELRQGSSRSTLSWKSCEQNKDELDPLAAFVMAHGQEPVFANKRSENGDEPRASCSSPARNLFSELSLKDLVLPGPTARHKIQSSPTTRSSVGSSDYPFASADNPKADVTRGRSSLSLRGHPFEEQLGSSATRQIPSPARKGKVRQLQIVTAKALEADVKVQNSPSWLEQLKSSSLWPHHDSGGESGDDSEGSSPHSYKYHTPKTGSSLTLPQCSSTSSEAAPVVSTPTKPATIVVSKEVLRSSSMLQRKHQQQERHPASRSSFAWDQDITAVPSSSTALEQNDATCAPEKVSTSEQASEGEKLPTSGLPETPNSGSGEMRKEESKAAVGSSGRSFPIYLHRKGSTISKDRPDSSGDESSESSEDERTDSVEHKISRADILSLYQKSQSPLRDCKIELSENPETWLVSESELLESPETWLVSGSESPETWLVSEVSKEVLNSSSLKSKSRHAANQLDNTSMTTFREDSSESSTYSPNTYCSFSFSETYIVPAVKCKLQQQRSQTKLLQGANHGKY